MSEETREPREPQEPHDGLFSLTTAALFSIRRLHGARITSLSAQLDFFKGLAALNEAADGQAELLQGSALSEVHPTDVQNFSYVTDVSHLIYATAILDTYLSDVSLFLFLLHPASLGEDKSISLSVLLEADSKEDALTRLGKKVVRELGYLPFLGRLDALRKRFGLPVDLPKHVEEHLEHYSSVRNTLVHDHGFLEVSLSEGGVVEVNQKSCHMHPTPISSDDLRVATNACMLVMTRVYRAICTHVLKVEPDAHIEETGEGLEDDISTIAEQGRLTRR